jgi:hypothetical protein
MTAAIIETVPLAVSLTAKYCAVLTIETTIFATRKIVVYTIHGISSAGLPCKEKKPIEILKFLFCRLSLKYYCNIHNNDLFQYYFICI